MQTSKFRVCVFRFFRNSRIADRDVKHKQGLSWSIFKGLRPLDSKGMTTLELVIAMFIVMLILSTVPSLMQTVNSTTRDTIIGVRSSRKEHAAMTSLIKDVKSSETAVIAPDGKSITLQRSSGENGVTYTFRDGGLYYNNDLLLSNVTNGVFGEDGTVISATVNLAESEPIQLVMRRPSLKRIIDDGNAPVQPDFDNSKLEFRCNGTLVTSTSTKTITIPVVRRYEVTLETVDPMAQILYYTVDNGHGEGVSDRVYVNGNKITFETFGILKTAIIRVKIVAEDGINMGIYTIRLEPLSKDSDKVPDWMWGGDETFRMYMAREVFGLGSATGNLRNITFGQVRARTGTLNFGDYNITELGEIIGEFKQVQSIIFTDSWIDHLPESLCVEMQNLRTLNMRGCTRLIDNCPDGSYAKFRNNMLNSSWKNTNCRNVAVTWPR